VYWPGAAGSPVNRPVPVSHIDFILEGGRAVAFPVYQGTFDRRAAAVGGPLSAARRDHNIQLINDLRRSIDYLDSRSDIDTGPLVFYGHRGAEKGPPVLALEPRLRSGILHAGGVWPERHQPAVDSVTYGSRVKVPVLLLSGEFDSVYPVDTNARPWFQKLGSPALNEHVVEPGGHFVPRAVLVREILDWLDRPLGPVR
jgi:pimeloyl-ACP methyl ester carboxylesterase